MKYAQKWGTGSERVAVLVWETRACLSVVTSEQRPRGDEAANHDVSEKNVLDGGNSVCKDSEAEAGQGADCVGLRRSLDALGLLWMRMEVSVRGVI